MIILRTTTSYYNLFTRWCTSTTAGNSFYDIIIVGGGMVGNAMACAVGLSECLESKRVLVLDSDEIKAPTKDMPYGNRVSAVSPPAVSLFKKLGIWDDLVNLRVKRINKLQDLVWMDVSKSRQLL